MACHAGQNRDTLAPYRNAFPAGHVERHRSRELTFSQGSGGGAIFLELPVERVDLPQGEGVQDVDAFIHDLKREKEGSAKTEKEARNKRGMDDKIYWLKCQNVGMRLYAMAHVPIHQSHNAVYIMPRRT